MGETANEELLLGLFARPWLPTGGIVRTDPDRFINFDEPGYAKVGWNFSLSGDIDSTNVATETRIACTDAGAKRWFGLYWSVVRPFSGATRMEALKAIRRNAEKG